MRILTALPLLCFRDMIAMDLFFGENAMKIVDPDRITLPKYQNDDGLGIPCCEVFHISMSLAFPKFHSHSVKTSDRKLVFGC